MVFSAGRYAYYWYGIFAVTKYLCCCPNHDRQKVKAENAITPAFGGFSVTVALWEATENRPDDPNPK